MIRHRLRISRPPLNTIGILQINKQKEFGSILRTAIEADRNRQNGSSEPAERTDRNKYVRVRNADPRDLMLTYEQTRQLPKHIRATVQFTALQRQVLVITWRKLTGVFPPSK
jgi:hypothetical protein